ncbi:hypothetical protein [Tardiphaga alba]|uniref:hypothetical protein n=1 Tax=Tardiphaga alba TaxID=340268 RepID=UPI001BA9FBBE|nr:hypothetical protein [Tardiphaga alba]
MSRIRESGSSRAWMRDGAFRYRILNSSMSYGQANESLRFFGALDFWQELTVRLHMRRSWSSWKRERDYRGWSSG